VIELPGPSPNLIRASRAPVARAQRPQSLVDRERVLEVATSVGIAVVEAEPAEAGEGGRELVLRADRRASP